MEAIIGPTRTIHFIIIHTYTLLISMAAQSTTRSVLVASAAALSVAAALVLWNHWRQQTNHTNNSSSSSSSTSTTPTSTQRQPDDDFADPPLTRLFEAAARDSKHFKALSNGEKLVLYSLYKQSTIGNAPMDQPQHTWNVVERAKHSSWARIRGMSKNAAMLHYIQAIQQLQTGSSTDNATTADDGMEMLMEDMEGAEGLMGNTKPSSMANNEEDNGDGYQGQDLTLAQQVLRAASQNNVTILAALLERNPELANHRDEDGQSALHLAADKGASQALELLLQAGADGNAADADGITCLHAAVIAENIQACRILLLHGANPDQPDVDGDTPRTCAQEDGSDEMKLLFASHANSL
jgi:acyl-CoA-binding protein